MDNAHDSSQLKAKLPQEQVASKNGISRRSFLSSSALGAAAVALPTTLGCATTASASGQSNEEATLSQPSNNSSCEEIWSQPPEWDISTHGKVFLSVQEVLSLKVFGTNGDAPSNSTLFTYNGTVPGHTIRMGGDQVLPMGLVNLLLGNNGNYAYSKKSRFALSGRRSASRALQNTGVQYKANEVVPDVVDWKLAGELLYGPHQQHTINMHTHGLHVSPGTNPDGTHSDNVLLRIIPGPDLAKRVAHNIPLTANEVAGFANYEFRLGNTSTPPAETHPPGTHWYHPHPHGATYDQVASGMAGFIIVEGDVDASLNQALAGDAHANPNKKTGPYAYRERLMLLQRVLDMPNGKVNESEGAPVASGRGVNTSVNAINGLPEGKLVINMQPGAIERWRVLNGSVDGKGYMLFQVQDSDSNVVPQSQLHHLAFDGITLVEGDWSSETGEYTNVRYTTRPVKDYIAMAPANRSDVLFQVPRTAAGGTTYTIVGKVDNTAGQAASADLHIATICVAGDPVAGVQTLDQLAAQPGFLPAEVPQFIQPIGNAEISQNGQWRSRVVPYSGWGSNGYPCTAGTGGKNSMVISGKKFNPDTPVQKMLLGSAEEWTLRNLSVHVTSGKGSSAVDHPFHIHQNPFWVVAIYDSAGNRLNENYQQMQDGDTFHPRWQDVVRIPRGGGMVVFRSRFWNYHGSFVNHCHLLQHEDWGMMETVEVVAHDEDANYVLHTPTASEQAQGYRDYMAITDAELESRCYWILSPVDAAEPPSPSSSDTFDPPPQPSEAPPPGMKWYAFCSKSNRAFPGTIAKQTYPPTS